VDAIPLTPEVYAGVDRLIWQTVHRLANRHTHLRRDLDEAKQIADLACVEAIASHDPARAALTTWVANRVRIALLREVQARGADAQRVTMPPDATKRDAKSWEQLLEGLGDRARLVAQLAVFRPAPLEAMIAARGGDTPGNVRRALRKYLRRYHDWNGEAVTAVFVEIEEGLR
jgi:hypothetical protein